MSSFSINALSQTHLLWKECGCTNTLVLLSQGEKQGNLTHLKCSPNMTAFGACAGQDLLICAEHCMALSFTSKPTSMVHVH